MKLFHVINDDIENILKKSWSGGLYVESAYVELKEYDDTVAKKILLKSDSLIGDFYSQAGGYESWSDDDIVKTWQETFSYEQIIVQNDDLIAFFRHPVKEISFEYETVLLLSRHIETQQKTGQLLSYSVKYWDDEYLKIIRR